MKVLIENILKKWGCMHKWELHLERKVDSGFDSWYFRRTFICKECGKFKQKRV